MDDTPVTGFVGEGKISPVLIDIVRNFDLSQLGHGGKKMFLSFFWRIKRPKISMEIHEIHVRNIFPIAVAYKQVPESIIVKIREQWRPAPIGLINTRHLAYFTETAVPMV